MQALASISLSPRSSAKPAGDRECRDLLKRHLVESLIDRDTVAPDVSCVADAPQGGAFLITATDACSPPVIRLGSFVLADGERIKITEVGTPGITLVGTVGPDRIRHFHVGKGQGLITATDPSNNVGSAVCP